MKRKYKNPRIIVCRMELMQMVAYSKVGATIYGTDGKKQTGGLEYGGEISGGSADAKAYQGWEEE